jgi:hypothetical protein
MHNCPSLTFTIHRCPSESNHYRYVTYVDIARASDIGTTKPARTLAAAQVTRFAELEAQRRLHASSKIVNTQALLKAGRRYSLRPVLCTFQFSMNDTSGR